MSDQPRVDNNQPHEPRVATGFATTKDGRISTYQCVCHCGYRGPSRSRQSDADDDCVQHRIFSD